MNIEDKILSEAIIESSAWDRNHKGKYLPTYNNALLFLEKNCVDIKYNDFGSLIEINGERYHDNHTIQIKEKMRGEKLEVAVSIIDEAVLTIALRNRYHPVKDYLNKLKWDNKPRLETWLNTVAEADDNEYTRFICRTTILSAIYRIMEPGCQYDTMIIFEGDQGIGKSKIVRALGGEWYKSISLTDRDKDTIQLMQGAWFIEVPELSVFAKRDIESLKAFISNPVDSARFAYGRNDRTYPRQSVFIGTINPEGNGYLMDSTGNRRFLPIKLNNIKDDLVDRDRDNLFAEAMIYYKARSPIYATAEELIKMTCAQQCEREFHDDWSTIIMNYLNINKLDNTNLMTACDIWERVFKGRPDAYDKRIAIRISNILRKLGCQNAIHTSVNGIQGKYFDVSKIVGNHPVSWQE